MTSEIESAIKELEKAHELLEAGKPGAPRIAAKVARDLINAIIESNTLGPDSNNDPNDNRG